MESVWWYLDTRKFGTVPHSGFGLSVRNRRGDMRAETAAYQDPDAASGNRFKGCHTVFQVQIFDPTG